MLYLLLTVAHYKQLGKIDRELIDAIEESMKAVCARRGVPFQPLRDGAAVYPLGPEAGADPRRVLELVFPLYEAIAGKREELFGFQMLLSVQEEEAGEAAGRLLARELAACEEDEEIWIDAGAISLFGSAVATRRVGELWKVLERTLPQEAPQPARAPHWVQEGLVNLAFKLLSEQLAGRSSNRGLHLCGPVAQDRRGVLDALQHHLAGASSVRRFPRLYSLFGRRSALHPFLNSLDPVFLPHVGRYLEPHERRVWDSLADLLWYLKPSARQAASLKSPYAGWPEGVPCALGAAVAEAVPPAAAELSPDHLSEDFLIAYQLYLSAYFRLLEENLLPAVLICEDLETYQPATVKALCLLVKDFAQKTSFRPIFSSSLRVLPEGLGFLNPSPLYARPLRLKEMSRLASELCPGLRLSSQDWRRIRLCVRGKPVPFYHGLLFLQSKGLIRSEEDGCRWLGGDGWEQVLPKRPLTVSWQVAGGLEPELERVLFIAYLQQGLLDLAGLLAFLETLGFSPEQALRRLVRLQELGLIHISNHVVPLFPAFRKRLRKRILAHDPRLEDRLIEHLIELWRGGSYPHRVLLFFLLIKSRRTDTALEMLGELLKRKLDELDFAGVRIFMEQKHFRLDSVLSAEQKKSLALLLGAVRIRYHLLAGSRKEAEAAYLAAVDLGSDFQVNPLKGELFLQIARYLVTRGETNMALQWAKKSLLQFQGAEDPLGEREATLELGSVLLAESRLDEALEYFTLAEQSATRSPGVGQVRLQALRAAALLAQGNLSRAQTEAARGLEAARRLKRREWELFLGFLAARVLFELGSYEEAVRAFQDALAVEALYPASSARSVLYAWLGRAFAYSGKPEQALRILGQLKESWEQCLFLAETCYFGREYSKALEYCERALSISQSPEHFPGERILWTDGFSDVEGRCLVLSKDGALALRLIQSFQAFLWGLQGSVERASEQLHAITRSGRIPEIDPYQSLYYYWYACILPDLRQDEMDDRLTVLNKALQLLQQRASRIEDSTLRWHYLNDNHWNAGLFAEARKRKLI